MQDMRKARLDKAYAPLVLRGQGAEAQRTYPSQVAPITRADVVYWSCVAGMVGAIIAIWAMLATR